MPRALLLAVTALLAAGSLAAQHRSPGLAELDARIDTAALRQSSALLARHPRITGYYLYTPLADTVMRRLGASGLDTSRAVFRAYVPHPRGTDLYRVTPSPTIIRYAELRVGDDSATFGGIWPSMAAYSAQDSVTGPLVYVHFGRPEDYRELEKLRLSPQGTIVLARLGKASPAVLVQEAERRGAIGVILFTDPQDDGYLHDDPYPLGPMRHADAMRRLQVQRRRGDPSSPGFASTDSAQPRLMDESRMPFPRIPVASVSMRVVSAHLLSFLQYPRTQPAGWQGALPFRYHAGTGEARVAIVHRRESGDSGFKVLTNTYATLRGAEAPDEIVLVGAHRDAMGPGAADNASGVAALLESARLLGEAAAKGQRPRRTIVFATWDGAEFGEIGSVEHAEGHLAELGKVVAYVDLDHVADGRTFTAAAVPSLRRLLLDAAGQVAQPGADRSIAAAAAPATLGDLGVPAGAGDAAALLEVAGLPTINFGFRDREGVRWSGYDTHMYMQKFGDPGFAAHRAATALALKLMVRLADDPVPPLDVAATGAWLREQLVRLQRDAPATAQVPWDRLIAGAAAVAAWQPAASAPPAAVSAALRAAEQGWARDESGHRRHLLFGTDPLDGLTPLPLPALALAVRARDGGAMTRAADELAAAAATVLEALRPLARAASNATSGGRSKR